MSRIQIINTLITDEGLRLKPYRCTSNKLSIGVGRNLEDNGITKAEALILLNNDIDLFTQECSRSFLWFRELDEVRQEVMVMLCFNIGLTRLVQFDKMIAALAKGDFVLAAKEMKDSKWAKQVRERADRLSEMMLTGKYQK